MTLSTIKRTKDFFTTKPYTYTVVRKRDGMQYHGVRYGNVRLNLCPMSDFGVCYFSSGAFKSELKSRPERFTVKLRWTFDDAPSALLWESRVNKKLMRRKAWANVAVGRSCCDREKMRNRRENSFMKKYGVKHNFLIPSVKEKREKTIQRLYGVKNPGESSEIRGRVTKTCLIKFGVACSLQSEAVKIKSKSTMIRRHGVDNPLKSKKIREKMKKNCVRLHGCEFGFQREDVKNKIARKRKEMYVKLAKMTGDEFLKYLSSISQQKSVQNQKKAQRLIGIKILGEVHHG